MKWRKKGFIFKPNGEYDWMQSHITPLAAIVLDNKIRVFITTRSKQDINGNYISYTSFLDLDMDNPQKILSIHSKPIIELGKPGTFDEQGVMVAKPVVHNNKIYLYYMGWQRLANNKAPYKVAIGLAISEDAGLTFNKVSEGPVIPIDYYDSISIGNVFVLIQNGIFHMWYTSLLDWQYSGIKPTPDYNIKYASSKDGIIWNKTNEIVIKKNEKGGVATPTIFKKDDVYHMLFGYRKAYDGSNKIAGYNIGYASSVDLKKWERDDAKAGISPSGEGWDSQMICYPHVVKVKGDFIMFYCGNGFGKDGFGYAVLNN